MQKLWNTLYEHFVPSHGNTFRPYILRKSWLIFFLTIVLTTEGVFVAGVVGRPQQDALAPAAVVPGQVVAFTNVERARESEQLLRENAQLDSAAQAKADDMARKGYFAHVGPEGKEPWAWIQEANYAYRYAGENLAVRFEDSADVVSAWMASPTHRANIVKNVYTEIGVGVARGTYEGAPATFVVQYFGTPLSASAQGAAAATAQLSLPTSSAGAQQAPTISQARPQGESVLRQAAQAVSDSSQSTSWVLGGVLLLLMFALALAFFIHIEIQSHELLFGGLLVSGTAALFLVLNAHALPPAGNAPQAASVGSVVRPNVMVGEDAADAEAPAALLPSV